MYLDHYGLREPPFSITPDPRFVYLSERHRDALAHLLYGVGQGGGSGFVQLTGEVGTGKTTLSRLLLEQLPENARVALILNPLLSPVELLETICEELRIGIGGRRGNLKALVDALNAFLLDAYASGLRIVLIIDEAQNLSPAALEQVRLLTNLETPTQKLLQIILLGQPELRGQLARPELRQLAQRITARYHLDPLDSGESEAYLRHRWAVAGGSGLPFSPPALRCLHRRAGGIPRLLNVIAERALIAGYARGENPIGARLLDQAASEVLAPRSRSNWFPSAIAVAIALCIVAAWHWWPTHTPSPRPAPIVVRKPHPRALDTTGQVAVPQPAYALLEASAFAQRLAAGGNASAQAEWMQLLGLWSVRLEEGVGPVGPSCKPTLAPGLFCAAGNAHLGSIVQFDRPAILELRTNGRIATALLLGMGSTQALLQVDGETFRVRRGLLENALVGYLAILRGPSVLAPPVRQGDTGPGVAWLRDRLLPLGGHTEGAAYDAAMIAAVRGVQGDFGLHVDGIVGPETLLALMAADHAGPHLRKLPE